MGFRPKLWPTLFTVPALIALVFLGSWQVNRLHWKDTLIERLQERGTAAPVALPTWIDNVEAYEFRRVSVTGEYLHDKEFYVINRSLNGKPGLNIVTLLKRADDGGNILINRGWVPFEKRDPQTRLKGQVKGNIIVEGIVFVGKTVLVRILPAIWIGWKMIALCPILVISMAIAICIVPLCSIAWECIGFSCTS